MNTSSIDLELIGSTSLRHRILSRFLQIFFHLLYRQFAWTYDWVAAGVSLGLWNTWVQATLPYLKGPRILEVGHGPGHLQSALVRKGVEVFGIDVSLQMGRLAYLRILKSSAIPLLVNGYAQISPFPDCAFDQVVATFPSEYISEPATLQEIRRILIPGGEFILLPVAWITDKRLAYRLAAGLFNVTGQAPGWDNRLLNPIIAAGFEVKAEHVFLDSSTLMIIHAYKPAV